MAVFQLNVARSAPADVFSIAAPASGGDAPKAKDIKDGDATVSTQTGALSWSYPIAVPPGRNGVSPSLASQGNIVRLPHGAGAIHNRISGLYSSIRRRITGSTTQTVREWLGTQSFDAQYQFGLQAIHNISYGIW